MIAVLGPPGSGKTTLAAALTPHLRTPVRDAAGIAASHADAALLLIDATWNDGELHGQFERFAQFLTSWQADRRFARTPAGLPVILVLTKCDTLPAADPATWQLAVDRQLAVVEARFAAFAAARPGFGTLRVSTAATATQFPRGPTFAGLDGPFGVADLAGAADAAADQFRATLTRTRRALTAAVAALAVAVAGFAGIAAVTAAAPPAPPADPLLQKLAAFRAREGPDAVRFADARHAANHRFVDAIRRDAGFDRLPAPWQEYVTRRTAEYARYAEYRTKFDRPRLGPNDLRTARDAAMLTAELDGELRVPPGFADSPAGKLAAKWAADVKLLHGAEDTFADAYRTLVRREADLELTTAFDAAWRAEVARTLMDPPVPDRDAAVPGSATVAIVRGRPLTYAAVLDGDRVAAARAEWDAAKERLAALRDVSNALGGAGPLDPPPTAATLPRTVALLDAQPLPRWQLTRFPDPARAALLARFRPAFAAAVAEAKRHRDGPDLPAWGRVLAAYRTVGGPEFGTGDPAVELTAFREQPKLNLKVAAVEVTVPDDVRGRAAASAGPFTLTVDGTPHTFAATAERRAGPATILRYAAPEVTLSFAPTAAVTATATVRVAGSEVLLNWDAKSGYPFDRLHRPPTAKGDPVPGVRTEFFPAAWPALPLLLAGE